MRVGIFLFVGLFFTSALALDMRGLETEFTASEKVVIAKLVKFEDRLSGCGNYLPCQADVIDQMTSMFENLLIARYQQRHAVLEMNNLLKQDQQNVTQLASCDRNFILFTYHHQDCFIYESLKILKVMERMYFDELKLSREAK